MKYFAVYDDNGKAVSVGSVNAETLNQPEITKTEYDAIVAEMAAETEKADYADRVYRGEFTLAEVPTEWQDEVQMMVDGIIAAEGVYDPDNAEISDEDALAIIKGVAE